MNKIELDRRFTGYGKFKYALEYPRKSDFMTFHRHRVWCWDTFGPSTEIETQYMPYPEDDPINDKWCWEYTQWKTRIYFKSDQEMNWFALRWSV